MSGELISFPVKNSDKNFARLWLGGVVFIGALLLAVEGPVSFGVFVCVFMFVVGFFYFKQTVWGLADEVWDHDSFLLVIKSGHQLKLRINEIKSIEHTYQNHKHLITIKINNNYFGRSVTFRAAKGYPIFKSPKILNSLQGRINSA